MQKFKANQWKHCRLQADLRLFWMEFVRSSYIANLVHPCPLACTCTVNTKHQRALSFYNGIHECWTHSFLSVSVLELIQTYFSQWDNPASVLFHWDKVSSQTRVRPSQALTAPRLNSACNESSAGRSFPLWRTAWASRLGSSGPVTPTPWQWVLFIKRQLNFVAEKCGIQREHSMISLYFPLKFKFLHALIS